MLLVSCIALAAVVAGCLQRLEANGCDGIASTQNADLEEIIRFVPIVILEGGWCGLSTTVAEWW